MLVGNRQAPCSGETPLRANVLSHPRCSAPGVFLVGQDFPPTNTMISATSAQSWCPFTGSKLIEEKCA